MLLSQVQAPGTDAKSNVLSTHEYIGSSSAGVERQNSGRCFNAALDEICAPVESRVHEVGKPQDHVMSLRCGSDEFRLLQDQLALIQRGIDEIRQSQSTKHLQENQEKLLSNFVEQAMQRMVKEMSNNFSAFPPASVVNVDDVVIPVSQNTTSALPNGEADANATVALSKSEDPKDAASAGKDPGKDQALWNEFQQDVEGFDPHCSYKKVLNQKIGQKSFWHHLFDWLGWSAILHQKMPDSWQARVTEHWIFMCIQSALILLNAAFMGYETDLEVEAALQQPEGELPQWMRTCSLVFNIIFAVELVFRIISLRSWFWVAPGEWGWNYFDVVVVAISVLFNLFAGVNLSFIRTFRILRVFRAARLLRVLRVFRKLREMLYSILSCLSALTWAFVFLVALMFMFSLICVQGAAQIDFANETDDLRQEIQKWFGSISTSMFTLGAIVTGGVEWVNPYEPLSKAGFMYSSAFLLYFLFVQIGVMNVLTAVFLQSAGEFVDVDIIVQNEQMRIEQFCDQVMKMFYQITGEEYVETLDWKTFEKALESDIMQAYMHSLGLEPTHIRLVFDLLDRNFDGIIDVDEFVMGLVKLKGEAKAIDARIIQRELGMMPMLVKQALHNPKETGQHSYGTAYSRPKDLPKRKSVAADIVADIPYTK